MTDIEFTLLLVLCAMTAVSLMIIACMTDTVRELQADINQIQAWLRRLDEDLDSHDQLEHERFEKLKEDLKNE